LKAPRNAPGHSGRRIPHPLSQTRLPTAAKSNSQEMCEHELSAEPTGLAESTSKQIPVNWYIYFTLMLESKLWVGPIWPIGKPRFA
jgi:hypothetical protein